MTDRCAACPARADLACQAGVFCEWAAAGDPVHRRIIVAAAEGRIVPAGSAAAPAPPAAPQPLGIPLAGNVVEAIAKRIGADRLAAWWAAKTGRPCGCAERRERMNAATRRLLRLARFGR